MLCIFSIKCTLDPAATNRIVYPRDRCTRLQHLLRWTNKNENQFRTILRCADFLCARKIRNHIREDKIYIYVIIVQHSNAPYCIAVVCNWGSVVQIRASEEKLRDRQYIIIQYFTLIQLLHFSNNVFNNKVKKKKSKTHLMY